MIDLKPGERIDDLVRNNLKIIQSDAYFCFSIDAVLLANFVTVKNGDKVVDLGTGCGVIPLLLTTRFDGGKIYGLEIQPGLAEMAARSVSLNGLGKRVEIMKGDLKDAPRVFGLGKMNVVVSNPPYRPLGLGKINPHAAHAIARHEIKCTLSDVVGVSAKLVNTNGRVAVVYRPERIVDLLYHLRINQLEPKRLRFVYPQPGKGPNMVLVEAIKGGGRECEVLPPLYVYDRQGNYTEELMEIYYPGKGAAKDHE